MTVPTYADWARWALLCLLAFIAVVNVLGVGSAIVRSALGRRWVSFAGTCLLLVGEAVAIVRAWP